MKKSEKTVGAKKLIPLLGLMAALLFTGCGEASYRLRRGLVHRDLC